MQILHELKHYLDSLGYQKSTKSMIVNGVKEYLTFTNYENNPRLTTTAEAIKIYHKHLQLRPNKRTGGGLSESYINHQVYSLKVFFEWLVSLEQIEFNPMAELSFKPPSKKPRKILSVAEVKELYKVSETHLERAILGLYYGCGLRRSEGIELQISDIHFSKGFLYVKSGKYNKRRVIPLSKQVKDDLRNYLILERDNPCSTNYLLNQNHQNIRGNTCNKLLKQLLLKADLETDISLHSLRHSIATHLLNSGMNLEYVQSFLGHSSLETTQIYTRVDNEKLLEL